MKQWYGSATGSLERGFGSLAYHHGSVSQHEVIITMKGPLYHNVAAKVAFVPLKGIG